MVEQIGAFFGAVGGVLRLNADAIRAIQSAPDGLAIAMWILVLGTLSDVVGDSPLLFINRMRPGRFAAALGIEAVLSIARLVIWLVSFWVVMMVLRQGAVSLAQVVLVVGIGFAPMLLSFLVIIPSAGPLIGRILQAWTLVAILASMALAVNQSSWQLLATGVVVVLAIVLARRWSDRLSVTVLGRISHALVGVDVMQRTRAMDPLLAIAARTGRA
ncbi:MAG TPA: hypothetical protein VFG86_15285 [Chloroflexota bacterium]|nr:hypothetical protein [Chloroflexota bacterium]